jgi:hypothetical protein
MRPADTSIWIEWLIGSPLGIARAAELPDRAQGWYRQSCNWNWRNGDRDDKQLNRPIARA